MTTQEYIQKRADRLDVKDYITLSVKTGYTVGLSEGIELAKEFAEWVLDTGFKYDNEVKRWEKSFGLFVSITTSELFEIFLTENTKMRKRFAGSNYHIFGMLWPWLVVLSVVLLDQFKVIDIFTVKPIFVILTITIPVLIAFVLFLTERNEK